MSVNTELASEGIKKTIYNKMFWKWKQMYKHTHTDLFMLHPTQRKCWKHKNKTRQKGHVSALNARQDGTFKN